MQLSHEMTAYPSLSKPLLSRSLIIYIDVIFGQTDSIADADFPPHTNSKVSGVNTFHFLATADSCGGLFLFFL